MTDGHARFPAGTVSPRTAAAGTPPAARGARPRARRGLAGTPRATGGLRGPAGVLVALLLCLAPARAAASDDVTVYLDKAAALEAVFPGAARVVELRHVLTAAETQAIETLTGRRLAEGGFFLYAAWPEHAAAEPSGYAIVVAEIGKVRPITHIVSVTPAGTIGKVAVMIYRESHGAEVAAERFMEQYAGKSLADPLRIEKDIINIAGSTLSGHAICRGVRKALAVVRTVLLDRAPSERSVLLAAASDVTPARPALPATGSRESGDGHGARDHQDPRAGGPAAGASTGAAAFRDIGPGMLRAERAVMGSACSIDAPLLDDGPAEPRLRAALAAALDEVARWDAVLSDWRPDTPLSRLNAAPAGTSVGVDRDLLAWLEDSRRWWLATDGAFDPGVGALVDAWGLRTPAPARPAPAALSEALARSGLRQLRTDRVAGTVLRQVDGLLLDPGASGKGWALDRAAEVLAAHGVRSALLSFGSSLLALDAPPGRAGWPVPVVHDGSGAELCRVLLAHGALSVSGGGFSTFEDGGVERGHCIDPRTGEPVPAGRLAWVRHASAAASDALATALLVSGPALAPVPGASGGTVEGATAAPVAWGAPDIAAALPAGAARR